MNAIRYLLALILVVTVLCAPALAHKVTVFAWVEGDTVHTESKFSGGKKVNTGKIEVYDHRNQKLIEGLTDGKGYFAFPLPDTAEALKVVLIAGEGHSNAWQITGEELGKATAAPHDHHTHSEEKPALEPPMDTKQLEQIVERAVEKKIAPLRSQLAEQAWGLRDIIAGIGYIFGLMGLATYVHYRKMIKDQQD